MGVVLVRDDYAGVDTVEEAVDLGDEYTVVGAVD